MRLRRVGRQLRVRIKIPSDEQDFNRIKIEGVNKKGAILKKNIINLNSRAGIDASSTEVIDTATYNKVTIVPQSFSRNKEFKTVRFDVKGF